MLAEWTGLEPATPGVTGRYSNQLNYHSFLTLFATIQTRTALPIISVTCGNQTLTIGRPNRKAVHRKA